MRLKSGGVVPGFRRTSPIDAAVMPVDFHHCISLDIHPRGAGMAKWSFEYVQVRPGPIILEHMTRRIKTEPGVLAGYEIAVGELYTDKIRSTEKAEHAAFRHLLDLN